MTHLSFSSHITFVSARFPISNPMAPSIMDFPAPVSPVITFKWAHGSISSDRSSA